MHIFARAQGFEPRPPGPEPDVLPLDDAPISWTLFPTSRKFTSMIVGLQWSFFKHGIYFNKNAFCEYRRNGVSICMIYTPEENLDPSHEME